MSVTIKTPDELDKMRVAGKLASQVLEMIAPQVEVGITTGELDRICHDYIVNELDAVPAPLNYNGFPKSICTSINEVVCHGIPSDKKALKSGDIINIDITVIKDGYHGDTSMMFCLGKTAPHAERLVQITQECLYRGIEVVKPGATLGDIVLSSSNTPRKTTTRWSASTADTALAQSFTRSPRYCTTAERVRDWS